MNRLSSTANIQDSNANTIFNSQNAVYEAEFSDDDSSINSLFEDRPIKSTAQTISKVHDSNQTLFPKKQFRNKVSYSGDMDDKVFGFNQLASHEFVREPNVHVVGDENRNPNLTKPSGCSRFGKLDQSKSKPMKAKQALVSQTCAKLKSLCSPDSTDEIKYGTNEFKKLFNEKNVTEVVTFDITSQLVVDFEEIKYYAQDQEESVHFLANRASPLR